MQKTFLHIFIQKKLQNFWVNLKNDLENRIAFRWRTQKEVVDGKGQFICAQKKTCTLKDGLRTWEVNFGYLEDEKKKFALVKVRLCAECRNPC